ncbi:MAG: response regulator transcription factor [Bacteroidaceae bacterium]|nr:response regulator transcription factor [Bacteroidaceae bacterium]
MMKVLAIDDEPLALKQVVAYIQRIPFLQLVGQCLSAIEAQTVLRTQEPDLIFCDINMPDLNGLDFVRGLSAAASSTETGHVPLVIFTTAYSEYAIEGFKVEAVDYLLKPFSFSEFRQAVERARSRRDIMLQAAAHQAESQNSASPSTDADTLFVRADHTTIAIPLPSIRYIQGMSEYLRIYTSIRPRPIITLLTMKSMEERLPSDRFLRIHRSSIVALNCISEVSRSRLVLNDGTELSVGDNYRPALEEWVAQHIMAKR